MNTKAELLASIIKSERVSNVLPVYIQVNGEYLSVPGLNASGIVDDNEYVYVRMKPRLDDGAFQEVWKLENGALSTLHGRLSFETINRKLNPPPAWLEDAEKELLAIQADADKRKRELEADIAAKLKDVQAKASAAGYSVVGTKLIAGTGEKAAKPQRAKRGTGKPNKDPNVKPEKGKIKADLVGTYIFAKSKNATLKVTDVDANGVATLEDGSWMTIVNNYYKRVEAPKGKK